jgi:peptidoglycan/xylan/chitin deacetylase (PgdA/CDA1 family)
MELWKSSLLHLYYYGSLPYRWAAGRRAEREGRVPVIVLLYHRIADDAATPWTTSNRSFERQVLWLADRFDVVSLEEAVRRIRSGENHRPTVSITFDDGYADNCRHAVPLLVKHQLPATYFVTLRNVLRGEPYPHDLALGHELAPNTLEQLRAMAAAGIEIGGHTYSHPDLAGVTDPGELHTEVVASGEELGMLLGRRVRYFAFPYGQPEHLNPDVFDLAQTAGYEAVCSAFGGYNFPGDDAFHVRRIHGDEEMIRLKNRATVDPRKVSRPASQSCN